MNTTETPIIKVENPDSRWVALDISDNSTIIAEGVEPGEVIEKAKALGKEFSLMFVPSCK